MPIWSKSEARCGDPDLQLALTPFALLGWSNGMSPLKKVVVHLTRPVMRAVISLRLFVLPLQHRSVLILLLACSRPLR